MPSSRVLTAATALAAIGATYLVTRRSTSDRTAGSAALAPVSTTARGARSLELAKVGAGAGAGYAAHRARRALAPTGRRDELDAQFQLRTAEQVAELLGGMKGALMKIGQMASYLDQGLPEPVRDALAQLQSDAPPMAPELARQAVEADLGAPIEELFATFDDEPIAAASIGQVHRATLADGREVAVKVQYPGVDEAIRSDLSNAGLLFQAMGMLFPGLEPGPLVEELRSRLIEELDYELEARNQQLFADAYSGHPNIHIPQVVPERSAKRVLTTELADGARFDEMRTWSQEEQDLAGEAIFRFVFRSLYRLRAFNGDPHPGNYLFRPGGQVTFLDFGLVKRFDPSEIKVFSSMIEALVLESDVGRFRSIIEEVGLLPKGAALDDERIRAYFGHFYEFVLADETRTMTPEYASESVRRIFDASGPDGDIMKQANVPPSFVLIQRINLGLYAILGDLGATRNWRRIAQELWPFVDGAPSTPMGEAEHAWLVERGD